MGSPIVSSLQNTFRYLPQHAIDGVFGQKWGPRVENMMGMSPAPDGPTLGAVPPGNNQVDPADVQRATESFRPQPAPAAKPNIMQMRKPLRNK